MPTKPFRARPRCKICGSVMKRLYIRGESLYSGREDKWVFGRFVPTGWRCPNGHRFAILSKLPLRKV